jgi:replicative DNA helicase
MSFDLDLAPQIAASHDSELDLLAKLLMQPGLLGEIQPHIRDPKVFYYEPHKRIWEGIQAVAAENRPADFANVTAWLEARQLLETAVNRSLIRDMFAAATSPSDPLHLAEYLKDLYERRRIGEVGGLLQRLSSDVRMPLPEVRQRAEQAVYDCTQTDELGEIEPLSEILVRCWAEYEQRIAGEAPAQIPTGLYDLDAMLGGGLRIGTLTTIMGRPAMGKTASLLTLACKMATEVGVAIFSLEMSKQQLMERLIVRSGIPRDKWQQGIPLSDRESDRLVQVMQQMETLRAGIDDSSTPTIVEMGQKLRRMISRHQARNLPPLRVVFVDYLQLLCPGNGPQAIDALSRTTKALCALAKDLGVAVVLLSQVNRSKESQGDKRPTLSDARGSGTTEEDSAVVVGLYREAYYNPQYGPESEWILLKNRFGPTGTVKLLYEGSRMEFLNIEHRAAA